MCRSFSIASCGETGRFDHLMQPVREIRVEAAALAQLIETGEPVLLRGLISAWPLVRAARRSDTDVVAQIRRFDRGLDLVGFTGAPAIKGRFHYDASATAMNFHTERMTLDAFLTRLMDSRAAAEPPALYLGSTDIDTYLPGLRAENDLAAADGVFDRHPPIASIWIGNRTTAAAHYDMANNAACCVAGRRRFTLFPPNQIANLYPGPLAPTPGGQVISMVDIADPDLRRHPRYREAHEAAQFADLEPGDVLVYPALWWHNVEALDPVNILINFWWNDAPPSADSPMDSVMHALLTLRDRPDPEKAAWRELFDYYVFGPSGRVTAHLPPAAHGPLAPLDRDTARQLRAYLLSRINR
jgi:hypothetical protein